MDMEFIRMGHKHFTDKINNEFINFFNLYELKIYSFKLR